MIRRQTVFVLGAGASYPYGFPTGEGLVNEIINLASADRTLDAFLYNGCVDQDVKRFARDLADSDAPSVDAFLEYRPDFLKIGKLAICLSLIPTEQDNSLARGYRQTISTRSRMAWYQYLWNEMVAPKGDFGGNRVSFVTLNYDRSLERYFFLRLRAQHQYQNNDQVFEELYKLRFVHVYGSLGDMRFEDSFDRLEPTPDDVQRAANRLRIIHEETTQAEYLSESVAPLKDARVLCFLGYGFHHLNNQRLTLSDLATADREQEYAFKRRDWFTTRYGMTDAEFRRRTTGFYDRFVEHDSKLHIGYDSQGALEVLRNLEIIE